MEGSIKDVQFRGMEPGDENRDQLSNRTQVARMLTVQHYPEASSVIYQGAL